MRPWHARGLVDSTSAEAWRLLEKGEPPGFVVAAEGQTAGRGREGRAFHSPAGGGLWASVSAATALPPAAHPAFGVAAGVAAAETLAEATGLAVRLRWPNDLMAGELKLGGILVESRGNLLVIGIGINLGLTAFPKDLKGLATSVALAGGRVPSPDALLDALLRHLDPYLVELEGGRTERLLARWRGLCGSLGRTVTVEAGGRKVRGVLTELTLDGIVLGTGARIPAGHVTRLVEAPATPGRS